VEKFRQKTTTFFSLIFPSKKADTQEDLGFFFYFMVLNLADVKGFEQPIRRFASISPFFTSSFFEYFPIKLAYSEIPFLMLE